MTDPAGAGIYANMTGVFLDGFYGTPKKWQHRMAHRMAEGNSVDSVVKQ